jgi:hypothetical protein
VAAAALWILYANCDPTPAGSDPDARESIAVGQGRPPAPPLALRMAHGEPVSGPASVQSGDTLTGRWAMLLNVLLLERGCAQFKKTSDYTATFLKQERLGGTLGEVQTLKLKMRHEPFSVYMKWTTGDKGRELIYVDGQNDGKLLVQPGGWKGRLTGTLALDPAGTLAMSETRHPVTKAGLVALGESLLEYHHKNLASPSGWQCELQGQQTVAGRDCYVFVVHYDSPEVCEIYRKSLQYIDCELSLPICVKNYTWPADAAAPASDDDTLIESYTYTDIRFAQRLADADFDQTNSSYRFSKK